MTDATESGSGSIETRDDVGRGNPALARFWAIQLDLADEEEAKWRKRGRKVCDLYADVARAQERERSVKFNILYSNVQTLAPALLPSTPRPDVRRRFRDEDKVGGIAADMLERCASTLCDQYDFDHICKQAILDRCLPGRAVARVEYEPVIEDDEQGQPARVAYQSLLTRQVHWEDFRRGPGRSWDEVTWVAFRHKLRREDCVRMFGDRIGRDVPLNLEQKNDGKNKDSDDDPNIYRQAEVWEIWDKDRREVVWLSKPYKDRPLKIEADPLRLQDFYPIPRPLYAIPQADNLIPVEEFRQYEDQARELDKVTQRIDKIVSGLKVRGISVSTIAEFAKLANADDNTIIQTSSGDAISAMQQGGMDKAVWMWPIDTAIAALKELYVQREAIKQTIYEINGIADILRGSVDPNEKLGQSQLKASWGSRRLETGREEAQRFFRDLIRLKIEIIAEHFEPEQIMLMSGIRLPTQEQKAQAQQLLAMQQQQPAPMQPGAQPQAPQVPPQIAEMLEQPSIEEVMAVIRSDALRTFRVDVETDQTVVGDEAKDKQTHIEFLRGTAEYFQAMAPVVAGGVPMKFALGLYAATARRFKLGRDVEDELAALVDNPPEPPPPPPDPDLLKAQTEAKLAEQDQTIREREAMSKIALAKQESDAKLAMQREEQAAKMQMAQQDMDHRTMLAEQDAQHQRSLAMDKLRMEDARVRDGEKAKLEDSAQARRDDYEAKGTPLGQAGTLVNVAQQFSEAVAAMTQALNMLAQAQMADTVLIKGPDGRPAGARKVMPAGATLQ